MYLIDYLHQHGIGVILDWVPSHFPSDEFGLAYFDGTHLYEHSDPRQGFHPDWGSAIFNYGRHEVRSFLHVERHVLARQVPRGRPARRCRRVACSTSTTRASRASGCRTCYGGNENLDAIDFLRRFNEAVYREYPDVQTYAEESTAWSQVSPADEHGRARVRAEVGHGVDARHAEVPGQASRSTGSTTRAT